LDDSSYNSLLALLGLLALHALIVLAANALTHVRQSPLRDRAEAGDKRAARALSLIDTPARLAITTHFSLTLIKFLLAGICAAFLVPAFVALNAQMNLPLSHVSALILLGLIGYVFADLLPSTLARAYADRLVLPLALIMQVIVAIFLPFVWLFLRVDRAIAKMNGGDELSKAIIEDEIIDLVEASDREGALEADERDMIKSVLEFDETMVREIMVPRVDITAVDINESPREAVRLIIVSGHSRIPAYQDEIDDIRGLLYAKDLLTALYNGELERKTITELMRPVEFVPETKRAEDLFREFQNSNTQLAIVVDEFGSTAGVISIEDIVEEIVGDIRDEYDTTEVIESVRINENEYAVDASINLYDFNRLFDVELPTDESDSLGGYLYQQFGKVPEVGATLETGGLRLRIESVEGVRIRLVHVERITETQPSTEPEQAVPVADVPAPPEESPQLEPRSNEV
jgi:CBS domain containing-hemolysin-like protein